MAACAVLVVVVAAACYANSLSGEFFLDNAVLVKDNPMVTDPENAGRIFTSHYWAPQEASDLYRPLTIWTYHLQRTEREEAPRSAAFQQPRPKETLRSEPYHVFNLALHTLNALLALLVLLNLSRTLSVFADDRLNVLFAGFGAALFAAHPIATEAVTNIVGRADLLVMFFLLLGFLLHMRGSAASGARAARRYIGAAACMALGLLSKENAVAMVAVLAAFDLLFLWPRQARKDGRGFGRWLLGRLKACYGFYALVLAGWLLVRYLVLHDLPVKSASYVDNPLAYMPFLQREATAVVVLGLYLWRMLWPVTLSADYSAEQIRAVQSLVDARFLGSLAALAVTGVVAVLMWKRARLVTFLILFFFIALFPVSNMVVLTGTIGAERLLYVSSLGWAGCLALAGLYLAEMLRRKWREAGVAVPCVLLGVIVILYGWRTHTRNDDWKDEISFWSATAGTSDRSARALRGYARKLYQQQEEENLDECRRLLERALDMTDRYVAANATLGTVYNTMAKLAMRNGNRDEAMERLDRAEAVLTSGIERDRIQEEQRRKELAAAGHRMGPLLVGNWRLYLTLGDIWATRSRILLEKDEATEALERGRRNYRIAVLAAPHNAKANTEYAAALMRIAGEREGDEKTHLLEAAAVSLWRAVISDPSDAYAWRTLGSCYQTLEYKPEQLIAPAGAGFTFVPGDNENRRYQIRAFRSLIMITRISHATDSEKRIEKILKIAAGYGIPRSQLKSAMSGSFALDDPVVLTGQ